MNKQSVDRDTPVGTLPGNTTVIAVSTARGKELLTTLPDTFVQNQSQFDRQARLNLQRAVVDVTLDMYLDYVRSQVLPWSESEIIALQSIIEDMATKFARLDLTLPDTVYLVKTSGLEEGYAAYTRKQNVIVLPANMVDRAHKPAA